MVCPSAEMYRQYVHNSNNEQNTAPYKKQKLSSSDSTQKVMSQPEFTAIINSSYGRRAKNLKCLKM